MTYKESLNIAFLKTDSDQADYDAEIFPVLANEAQMYIAMYGTHITKKFEFEVESVPSTVTLPDDFYKLAPLGIVNTYDEKQGVDYYLAEDNCIVIKETGKFVMYYWAIPTDITKLTDAELDEYEYEVSADTHVAIPSYIGYQLTKTDDVQLAQILLNEWNKYMSMFEDKKKAVKKTIKNMIRWW